MWVGLEPNIESLGTMEGLGSCPRNPSPIPGQGFMRPVLEKPAWVDPVHRHGPLVESRKQTSSVMARQPSWGLLDTRGLRSRPLRACPIDRIVALRAVIRAKPETGFEPVTPCLQDRCSGQLSYSGATLIVQRPCWVVGRALGGHPRCFAQVSRPPSWSRENDPKSPTPKRSSL
jgi:hypothetical protein